MENLSRVGAALEYERRRAKRLHAAMALLGCAVAAIVTFALMNPAISMTGDVMCGLEEHTHDASCYEAMLTCGLEEGEGHQHSDECYEQVLTCGLEEHQHTDACYEQADEDAEGESPATEEDSVGDAKLVPREALYRAPEADGTEAENSAALGAEAPATETPEPAINDRPANAEGETALDPEANPAQTFLENILDAEGNIALTVAVDAPAGALPAGATMRVKPVEPQAVADSVSQALLAAGADEEQAQSEGIQAVDIAFFDADGAEIEPAAKITVRLTSAFIADNDDVVLVHVPDEGEGAPELVAALDDEAIAARALQAERTDLYFESDKFSTYALTSAPMLAAAASGTNASVTTIKVGETAKLTGQTYNEKKEHKWTSSDTKIATVSGNGATGTVMGVAPGTVTITHVNHNNSDKFTVTVKAAEERPAVEEGDSQLSDTNSAGFTVSVKGTGQTKKLDKAGAGYRLVVEDAVSEYASEEDVQAAYHIYLVDGEGNEAKDLGTNPNLQVTLTYDTLPEWFNAEGLAVKHYKHNSADEQYISKAVFDANARSITFMVKGFSDFVIRAGQNTSTAGGTVTTQQGSILDNEKRKFNDANQWQIVSREYTNNNAAAKTSYGDDSYQAVRVQKDVIPTATENEFFVYLSVDAKMLTREYLQYATYQATTSNNYHNKDLGTVVDAMTGNEKVEVSGESHDKWNSAKFTIQDSSGKTIVENTTLWWSQANNVTFYLKTSSGKYILMGIKVEKDGSNTVRLSSQAEKAIYEDVMKVIALNSVTDKMGDYIDFIEVVDGDYSTTPTCSNGVLTWNPVMKAGPKTSTSGSGSEIVTWNLNAAELLYKVRLNVSKRGFNSCAQNMKSTIGQQESYPVNNSAKVDYTVSIGGSIQSDKNAIFQVPYVRGLLYDFQLNKVDQDNNPMSGVDFTYASDATQGKTSTAGNDGKVVASGLPWGTYNITELTVPKGYRAADPLTAELCYTTNKANMAASANNPSQMTLSSWQSGQTVVNKKNVITFTKQVATSGDMQLGDVNQTIYIALWTGGSSGHHVTDEQGNIIYRTITITNGVPHPATVTFEDIDTGIYDIDELVAVSGSSCTSLSRTDLYTSSANQDVEFQVGVSGSNDADLTKSNTAEVTLTNTYSYPTEISFVANKRWVDPNWNELTVIPTGAQATFTLYRSTDNGMTYEVAPGIASIVLDGTPDTNGETAEWQATFSQLPRTDGGSVKYMYAVRETSFAPSSFEPWWSREDGVMGENDYMKTSGGFINNKQKGVPVKLMKTNSSGDATPLPGAVITLTKGGVDVLATTMHGAKSAREEFTSSGATTLAVGELELGQVYTISESQAPNGYNLLAETVSFKVVADAVQGKYVVQNASGAALSNENVLWTDDVDSDGSHYVTIKIINKSGAVLPSTGGSGTLPYTLGGLALVAAALMYGWQLTRRGRRSETQPRIP